MKLPLVGKVFDSCMFRYTSIWMCTYTCHVMTVYLIQGTGNTIRWTPGEQSWTQHWCPFGYVEGSGEHVCCKHLSIGVGPGSSCWTYREQMCKTATGQKMLHSSRTSAYTSIPPLAVCACVYTLLQST